MQPLASTHTYVCEDSDIPTFSACLWNLNVDTFCDVEHRLGYADVFVSLSITWNTCLRKVRIRWVIWNYNNTFILCRCSSNFGLLIKTQWHVISKVMVTLNSFGAKNKMILWVWLQFALPRLIFLFLVIIG